MEIEWLILSDAAQVVGNKLYLLGGGWDVLTVNSGFPVQRRCAVSIAFRVPWTETNQRHEFGVEITDDDGHRRLAKLNGGFEVGRPPGIRPGQDQRVQTAVDLALRIDNPGQYAVVATIDGEVHRRASFNVVEGPGAGGRQG